MSVDNGMTSRERYHAGEVAVQERTGEREVAIHRARMIQDAIAPPAQSFLAGQRTVALGAVDEHGRPWASLWLGAPGFVTSHNGLSVRMERSDRTDTDDDPLSRLLLVGHDVGALAIDLGTRRRLRINGVVSSASGSHIDIVVRELFPNCSKYIQQRDLVATSSRSDDEGRRQGESLDADRQSFVASVDTLFVASRHPTRGVDVSHRGGARGFVRVVDERTLRVPDYPGNGMFQTLGNFEIVPRAGVIMVDFERGRFLSLTGRVTSSFGVEDPDHPSGGTGRYWEISVEAWLDFPMPTDMRFRLVERSPYNPPPRRTRGGTLPSI